MWFIIYFAVVLAYLLLNQGGSIDLDRAPQWAFRAFAFGGLAIFSILGAKRIQSRFAGINLRGILPISLILLLISSNIVSIRPVETVEETMNILAYASLAFLCYVYIDSLKRLRQFIEVMLIAGFLIAFHGLFIFYGALWSRGETTPLSSLFYWHNPCAGFLLLIWPTMLAQFYSLRRGWHTFLVLYIFYITFTAFGLTLSRGGWISGFFPFLLIPFILSRKRLMVSWRPILLMVLYFLSAVPFVLKYRGQFFQPIIDRWNQMRWDDYSVIGRFEFWDIAWRVFLKNPLLGIGFNTFGYYYVHYQTDPQYYTKDPHSIYLRFLVEGGIIGAAVVIAILAIVVRLIVKTLKSGPGKMLTVYRVGLLAGIVGELGHMALDFDWTFPVIPMLLVCQIAVVARTFTYPKIEQELSIDEWEPDATQPAEKEDEPEREKRKGWFIRPVAIWIGVALILFFVNIMGYVSMMYYEKGKDLVDNQSRLAQDRAIAQMSQAEREMMRRSTQESPTFTQLRGQAQSEIIQEGMRYWQTSLKYNPWNWYPLKDLLAAHYYGALDLAQSGADLDLDRIVTPGLEYGYRLLRVTPHRPASYYFLGQLEILAGQLQDDESLKETGLAKLLHSIELDPQNIPKYYLGIAKYYTNAEEYTEALKYLEIIEEKFVPLDDYGEVNFSALKGKSLARYDWIDITETIREAWWYKADILIELDRKEESLLPLYNGLNTPVGGGEMAEDYYDLGLLQLPFALRIAEIAAEFEDWITVDRRAGQVIDIITERDMGGTAESRKAYDLYYEAQSHLKDETGDDEIIENIT